MSEFYDDLKSNVKRAGGIFGQLVTKANQASNSETAKRIRKKLLVWGTIGAVIGFGIVIAGMILFTLTGLSMSMAGFSGKIIIGMVLFIIGAIISSVSVIAIKAGLAVVIAGVTTKFIDVQDYCPNCHDKIDKNEVFCNKCGANLRANKVCECGTQNDLKDEYCRTCGKKLK